jgi:putative SOS response-associated peptidase YedK
VCARYRIKVSLRYVAEILGLAMPQFDEFTERPRFNVTISQCVPVVKLESGKQKFDFLEWGFLPPWDKTKRIFNAAGETVAVKRTFSDSFKLRRCLMPADGFYEWPNKQPTLIRFKDDRPFCFAGLWLHEAVTMITAAPNQFMKPIHHRMPSILREQDYAAWLDADSSPELLQKLIAPRNWDDAEAVAINKLKPDEPDSQPSLFSDQTETAAPPDSSAPKKGRGKSPRPKG